jgi:hypothetical protein
MRRRFNYGFVGPAVRQTVPYLDNCSFALPILAEKQQDMPGVPVQHRTGISARHAGIAHRDRRFAPGNAAVSTPPQEDIDRCINASQRDEPFWTHRLATLAAPKPLRPAA